MSAGVVKFRLPATSANLGPGFDALGLAMDFALYVEAAVSTEDRLHCTGRDAAKIQEPGDNLVLATCREVLAGQGKAPVALALNLHNEIPLGMGCGSSAAALVAGVALANRFGGLGWTREQVLAEASRREGHPDNVAACVLGGFTASAMRDGQVTAVSLTPAAGWQLLLVLPASSLSTKVARGLLPETYSKTDAIHNLQNVALLTAAFANGDGGLLQQAMQDRMHQPYRAEVCPLLPVLTALAGVGNVLGVALSGAGPSVLLVCTEDAERGAVEGAVLDAAVSANEAEFLWTRVGGPATFG